MLILEPPRAMHMRVRANIDWTCTVSNISPPPSCKYIA